MRSSSNRDTAGNVGVMNQTDEKVKRTTAPVPRGVCGVCDDVAKLDRETGRLLGHGYSDAQDFCSGSGQSPTRRVTAVDRRRTGTPVKPAPEGAEMVTREQVAQLCGVTIRTVSRWAAQGYLTRYEDSRGRVAYARVQAEAMNRFEPVE